MWSMGGMDCDVCVGWWGGAGGAPGSSSIKTRTHQGSGGKNPSKISSKLLTKNRHKRLKDASKSSLERLERVLKS